MNRCIKCGKFGEFEALCSECYLQQHPMLEGFKDIKIQFCIVCKKYHNKAKWTPYEKIKEPIIGAIKEKLKINQNYELKELKVKPLIPEHKKGPGMKIDAEAELKVKATADGFKKPIEEKYVVPFLIDYTYCDKCGKSGTNYFAGILQLRNPNQKVRDYIKEKMKAAKSRRVFVTNIKQTRNGIDYYITDNSFIVKLAKELQAEFGGELKTSAKVHTKDKMTSKDVHRLSAVLRLPDYTKGDIILIDKNPVKITKMGKKIFGIDLLTGKQKTLDIKDKKLKILEIHKTTISKIKPELEALHPETYQNKKIQNPIELKPGQKVKVVIAKGKLFLVSY